MALGVPTRPGVGRTATAPLFPKKRALPRPADEVQGDRARRCDQRERQEATAVALGQLPQAAEGVRQHESPEPPAAHTSPVITPISPGNRWGTSWKTAPFPIPSSVMPVTSSRVQGPSAGRADTPAIAHATPR
jgi:hypothetical protein